MSDPLGPTRPGPVLNRGEPAERRRSLWEHFRQPDIEDRTVPHGNGTDLDPRWSGPEGAE